MAKRIDDFQKAADELAAEVLRWREAGMSDEDIDAVLADHNLHFLTMSLKRLTREMRMELKRDSRDSPRLPPKHQPLLATRGQQDAAQPARATVS